MCPMTTTTQVLLEEKRAEKTDAAVSTASPRVYDYIDYRKFLTDFIEFKNKSSAKYSSSMFARKAGLGQNSRGYLKLVVEGKRNLSSATIRGFSDAIGLEGQASLYFENLVLFNQSERPKDRDYYFQRLRASARGQNSKQVELLEAQYEYCSKWFVVAIRELVNLKDFKETPSWIAHKLKDKITSEEAVDALQVLLTLGLIERHPETKKLIQKDPIVKYSGKVFSDTVQNFHVQMMERAKESLKEDFNTRATSGVTLSIPMSYLPKAIQMIDKFGDELNIALGISKDPAEVVLQVNFQVFTLTRISETKESK